MRAAVFCMAKFHSFHMAQQLHRFDSLDRLYTSFYGGFGKRRNDSGINLPREKVCTDFISTFLTYVYSPGTELWTWNHFGNWAARFVEEQDIVISWGLSALPIIHEAQKRSIVSIVERGSAHAAVQRDLLVAEYEMHGQPTDTLQRSFSPQRMERELLEYELADYIEVPSEFAKRSFMEQGISEKKLIKRFLSANLSDFYELPKKDDIFRVVYTGHMSLRKGVHYLLQAFAELNLPNAELWLIGTQLPEIAFFFERYRDNYTYFGHVARSELHKYYASASVFAICSIEEGLAQVQPQAMACGLPVICTTNTGGEDLIEEGNEGFVIPIRNIEAIKEKILFLYENRDSCYQMGQAAKKRVQNSLTWDDYGALMIKQFTEILG